MQHCAIKQRDEQTKADTILLHKQVNDKIGIAESLHENKRQVLKNTIIGVGKPFVSSTTNNQQNYTRLQLLKPTMNTSDLLIRQFVQSMQDVDKSSPEIPVAR